MPPSDFAAGLDWPFEGSALPGPGLARFAQSGSNVCLDFHGDPRTARLSVFSDGNHHMALADALTLFRQQHDSVGEIFYVTTPPRVIVEALRLGGIVVGNLVISCRPDVFIGPGPVMEGLHRDGLVGEHAPFCANRGCVLLVRKGNPAGIEGVADLARPDVRLFLSNPVREKVSHDIYVDALNRAAARNGVDAGFLRAPGAAGSVVHGESIHHREAPQCVADGRADAAVVFRHLALRYVRVFPEVFEMRPLDGDAGPSASAPTHIGLVGSGGIWGRRLVEFMRGSAVAAIYSHHGLAPVG